MTACCTSSCVVLAVAGLGFGAAFGSPARADPAFKTQPPCVVNSTTTCVRFDWQTPPPQYIRTFTFDAPQAGSLLVMFQGSGNCDNADTVRRVADFDAQITTDLSIIPSRNGPGGSRVAFTLETYDPDTIVLTSLPFNLHASRIVSIPAAGRHRFYYRVSVNRIDTYVQCALINDTFTAMFTPQ